MVEERVHSGICGLDEILFGGLIAGRTYLLVGAPGAGKTIFSLQWLLDGVKSGDSVLYVTLAEPSGEIKRNVTSLGWDLSHIEFVDLAPSGTEAELTGEEYHVFSPGEVEQMPIWQSIYRAIDERRPKRVVIDSATQLRYLSTDEYQFRKHILSLVSFLDRLNCTSLLTYEPSELAHEMSISLAVDGIIRLRSDVSPSRVIGLRSLQVDKFRGSDFLSGLHPLRISEQGMVIFPHRIVSVVYDKCQRTMLSSGIHQFDDLLGGGIESGTATLLSGPTGVGKSTLALQFLRISAMRGLPAVMFAFEETVESVVTRSRGIGLPIEDLLQSGMLRIITLNPLELYPDEFLQMVMGMVEREQIGVVLIDSLRSYELAMEEFGSALAHIRNLVIYLTAHGVTTLMTQETSNIVGALTVSDDRASHICDNILLLRYAEYAGHLIKVVGCLKKRLGDFQPELRELRLTATGIHVGEQLKHMHGVLTGSPTSGTEP